MVNGGGISVGDAGEGDGGGSGGEGDVKVARNYRGGVEEA